MRPHNLPRWPPFVVGADGSARCAESSPPSRTASNPGTVEGISSLVLNAVTMKLQYPDMEINQNRRRRQNLFMLALSYRHHPTQSSVSGQRPGEATWTLLQNKGHSLTFYFLCYFGVLWILRFETRKVCQRFDALRCCPSQAERGDFKLAIPPPHRGEAPALVKRIFYSHKIPLRLGHGDISRIDRH